MPEITRRAALQSIAGVAAACAPWPAAATVDPLVRPIPRSPDTLPVVGLGTWITFNVGDDPVLLAERTRLLAAFFDLGGSVIDSSPMYGSAEAAIGHGLRHLGRRPRLFAATKVWTPLTARGTTQMAHSRQLWGVDRFDLMQVHNLLNWDGHLPALFADRDAGRIRYVGITTSHGRRDEDMIQLMQSEPIDVVQFSYNILDRQAEQRLLPLAADRGLAVIINRPFRTGELFALFARHPLPDFAGEIDCANWAQLFLKFILAHPAVTCVIPATSRLDHLQQNMGAMTGRLPDAAMRARLVRYVEGL